MTDPIRVLPYRYVEYERRPIFVVLAIFAIIFGVISEFRSGLNIWLIYSAIGQPFTMATLGYQWVIEGVVEIASMIFFIAAAVAFLAKSRLVVPMLCAHAMAMICAEILYPLLHYINKYPPFDSAENFFHTILDCARSFACAVFYLIVFTLLRTSSIQKMIRSSAGINEASMPLRD